MASIPLPALDPKIPQQPDILEKYSQFNAVRNLQQNAPLQRQALQQNIQEGELGIQQKQQQIKDQQAVTAAMNGWDGKDYNDILPLVLKNGGSAQAVMGLKKNILDQRTQIATAAKDNADAAQANITATLKKKTTSSPAHCRRYLIRSRFLMGSCRRRLLRPFRASRCRDYSILGTLGQRNNLSNPVILMSSDRA